MSKQNETKKVFLYDNIEESDRIRLKVSTLCRTVNNTIVPQLKALQMYDKRTIRRYIESADNVWEDYKERSLQGIDNSYLMEIATERAESELSNIIGDGWSEQDITLLQFCKWETTEDVEELTEDTRKIIDYCKVYAVGEQAEAYARIKEACNILTEATKGKCGNLILQNFPILCIDGKFSFNNLFNLSCFV